LQEEEEVENELREAMAKKGQKAPPKKKATFDHNVITPGTRFMVRARLDVDLLVDYSSIL
jgi:5'-3' exonuclease